MTDDLHECWEDLGVPSPELSTARSRLLGLLKARTLPPFPIIRRKFPRFPPWYEPLRKNIDYTSVGRKTFLVIPDSLETSCGKKP